MADGAGGPRAGTGKSQRSKLNSGRLDAWFPTTGRHDDADLAELHDEGSSAAWPRRASGPRLVGELSAAGDTGRRVESRRGVGADQVALECGPLAAARHWG